MSDALLQLFVFRDGAYVGSEIFPGREVVVGSGDQVDLKLDHPTVGSSHALLTHDQGQITLLDLQAGTGTQVNRAPIQHCYVTSRDEIQIGPFVLKLKQLAAQPASLRPSASSFPTGSSALPAAQPVTPKEAAEASISAMITDSLEADVVPRGMTGQRRLTLADIESDDGAAIGRAVPNPDQLSSALDSAFGGAPAPTERAPAKPTHAPLAGSPLQAKPSRGAPAQNLEVEPATVPNNPPLSLEPPPPALSRGAEPPTAPTALASELTASERSQAPAELDLGPPSALPVPSALPSPTAAPAKPGRPAPGVDEDEEDEDDIRPNFVLSQELTKAQRSMPADLALQLLAYDQDKVRASAILSKKGARYVLGKGKGPDGIPAAGNPGLKLATLTAPGQARIEFPAQAQGYVQQGGRRVPLDNLKTKDNATSRKAERYRYDIKRGDSVTLQLDELRFFAQFVPAPILKKEPLKLKFDRIVGRALGGAIFLHMLVFFVVGVLSPGVTFSDTIQEEWAELQKDDIRDVEIPKEEPPKPPEPEPVPEPEPTPEPEPEPEPKKAAPEPEPEPEPQPKRRRRAKRSRRGSPGPAGRGPKGVSRKQVKNAGVLGAVGKLNLAAPGRKAMVQAVSNIAAVKAPGGSNFRVGALVGKTPSSRVSVGGGGGGKLLTRGSAALLKGGKGFARIGRRSGSAKVRGSVRRVSARRLQAKGSISREAVARVINQHLSEVQYCYEKTLLKDRGLKGKLVLEWTIKTNGSVGQIRQKMSTLRNPGVARCIIGKMRRWRFPQPRGGIVRVTYPFIFSSVGF